MVLPYEIGFAHPSITSASGAVYATIPFQAMVGNGSGGFYPDASGIVSWMTHLNLTNRTGSVLPPAQPTCREWVPTIGDCSANRSGWFVVLESPYGEWLDSYGASVAGSNWSVPNVSIVSNQQLVIVCPAEWNVTGDVLTVSSTTAEVLLSGSVTL